MFNNLKSFEIKPSVFEGTFIEVNGRIMVWQDCILHTGYVYLP